MSKFREALGSDKFLVTVKVEPPKGVNLEPFIKALDAITGKVDGVTVPDNRSARIQLGPLAAALKVQEKGLDPILSMCCRDRNRLALCADALGAYAMGIENVLCVTGDYFHFGDAPEAKPVYDLDSVQAIEMIHQMEQGRDIGGNDLDGTPSFCVGCVGNPQAVPLEPQLLKIDKKLGAGVAFIQTLDIFDLEQARSFLEHLGEKGVKILLGIGFITDREVRKAREGKLPGNPIPREIMDEMGSLSGPEEVLTQAKSRMIEMITQVKGSGLCHGVHLTLNGYESLLSEILQGAGIQP
ncbi:MAG: methylenetetrahydrofolate reductase [Deltaproteobacteria bacterium]|nr:methylenetetrahydrofolate reductase [Deltaproteobacteria bacterium]